MAARRLRLESLEDRTNPATVVEMLKDIATHTYSSVDLDQYSSQEWVRLGDHVYFPAIGQVDTGYELWRTDGTPEGTIQVTDLNPGLYGTYFEMRELTVAGNKLYFNAFTDGWDLWVYDASLNTSTKLSNFQAGENDGNYIPAPQELTVVGDQLFFAGFGNGGYGSGGWEPWKSDGTVNGTARVKDVRPGGNGGLSSPVSRSSYFTAVNGTLFFVADDGVHGRELWKSDGTEAGTVLVKDIVSGSGNANPEYMANVNGTLFFSAPDGSNGVSLWKSDGTEAGTVAVKDIHATSTPLIFDIVAMGNLGFFAATDGVNGREVWRTDGTEAGTFMLRNIGVGVSGAEPKLITAVGNHVFFQQGLELWKSDGTTAGTVLVKRYTWPADTNSNFDNFTDLNGVLYFTSQTTTHGNELWKSDGTAAGTVLVEDAVPGDRSLFANHLTPLGDRLIFGGQDPDHLAEPWVSDGTATGTHIIKDISDATTSSNYTAPHFTPINGTTIFYAYDTQYGMELWKTDGTEAGTMLLKDIRPGYNDGIDPDDNRPFVMDGYAYFAADNGTTGVELWRTDGTEAGTTLVKDIWPALGPSYPKYFTQMGDYLYFQATNGGTGANGYELWRTDGTANGTALVKDIMTGGGSAYPNNLFVKDGWLYFTARETSNNYELWKTDGTAFGTTVVKDINPGVAGSSLSHFFEYQGKVFFIANDGTNGRELWTTDGTEAGTTLFKDINPGSASAFDVPNTNNNFYAPQITLFKGAFYFSANNGTNGFELWKSDGTPAGTAMFKNIDESYAGFNSMESWNINGLTAVVGDTMFFSAITLANGSELWKTDGTVAGTVMVKDIQNPDRNWLYPGSRPTLMTAHNGILLFSADDWDHGRELWRSDGTANGTFLVEDVGSLYGVGAVIQPVLSNGILFFTAYDEQYGQEPMTIHIGNPEAVFGVIAPNPRQTAIASATLQFNAPVTGFDLADLSLTRNGTNIPLTGVTLTSTDQRNWSINNLTAITAMEGTYVLTFTANGSGILDNDNLPPVTNAQVTWTVDLTPPNPPPVTGVSDDAGSSNTDGITNDNTLLIHGTAEPFSTVTVRRNGNALGTTITNASGQWTFDFTATTLPAGPQEFTARATDVAGNAGSESSPFVVVIDRTLPLAPTVTSVSDDTGSSNSDGLTNDTTLLIHGTAEANSTVTLFRNGTSIGSTAVNALGVWTFDATASTLVDGNYNFTAHTTDLAGNVGPLSNPFAVVVDTTIVPPTVVSVSDDTGSSTTDGITNDPTLLIHGTAEANSTVTVFRNGANIGTTTANASGTWTFDATSITLTEGTYNFESQAIDPAGNSSNLGTPFVVVADQTSPATPTVTHISDDAGSSNTDGITNDNTLLIHGTAEPFSTVTVRRNGNALGTTITNASGQWTFDFTATTLPAGPQEFTARATDVAGNAGSESSPFVVVIDRTLPLAPTVSSVSDDTGSSNSDGLTNDPTLLIHGTAEANSTVTLFRNGTSIGSTAVNALGVWTFDATATTLVDGNYNFTAHTTDLAGNVGPLSNPFAVVVDTTIVPPTVVSVSNDTGSSTTDGITNDPTLLIHGTAEANSTVTVFRNGANIGTTTANASGTWTFDATSITLADEQYLFTAQSLDDAGNLSSFATALSILVDRTAPNVPSILGISNDTGSSTSDGITSDSSLSIHGTAEPLSKVTLFRNGSAVGVVQATATGTWGITDTAFLADGQYQYTASAMDAAGNASGLSTIFTSVVDTLVPASPSITHFTTDTGSSTTDGLTNDTTPTLFGTAEPWASVTIQRNGQVAGTINADGLGDWSFTETTLPEGLYTYTASATDIAGNVGATSLGSTIAIDTKPPTATFTAISPNPRSMPVASITLHVDAFTPTLTLAVLRLTRDGGANLLTPQQTLTTTDGFTWVLGNLEAITTPLGEYEVTLVAQEAAIQDDAGNILLTNGHMTWSNVNQSPILTGPIPTLPPIPRDASNPAGVPIASFLASAQTDADANALQGIAVVGLTHPTQGTWQFSLDGGSTWQTFGTVGAAQARLLRAIDQVRFVPSGLFVGTVTLTFRAWDQTTGLAGTNADLSQNMASGGTTAFSANVASTTQKIAQTLVPVLEDAKKPQGQRVGELVQPYMSDIDGNLLQGIAIEAVQSDVGQWQYSLNNRTWKRLDPKPGQAVLLRATDSIRLLPSTNATGLASFQYRAWDQTSGTAGSTADTQQHGGATAFSAARDIAFVRVLPQNDAPVLDRRGTLPRMPLPVGSTQGVEQTVAGLLGSAATDVDGDAVGIAIVARTGSGTWEVFDGGSWTTLNSVHAKAPQMVPHAGMIRFTPDANFTGSASLKFHAWDGQARSRTASTFVVQTASTGSLNHAPELTSTVNLLPAVLEDTRNPKGLPTRSLLLAATDVDISNKRGIAVVGSTEATAGVWQYSLNGGRTWKPIGLVSEANALLLRDVDQVRFVPAKDVFGMTSTLMYRAWDRSAGTTGARANLTLPDTVGGNSAFSVNTASVATTIMAVNDLPVLDSRPKPAFPRIVPSTPEPTGTLVEALLANRVTDAENQATSMAITRTTGNGVWQYQRAGATTWQPLTGMSATTPMLLDRADSVRFVPALGWLGIARLTYRAWDGEALSRASETATVTVGTTDSRPVLATTNWVRPHLAGTSAGNGFTASELLVGRASDTDPNARLGLAIVFASTVGGTWQTSGDGIAWQTLPTVTNGTPYLLEGNQRLRFVPTTGFVGTAQLRYRAWDAASVNPVSPQAFSKETATLWVPVNTAPNLEV